MCFRKCRTVRSGGTTSVRSALMPTGMKSRASMDALVSRTRCGVLDAAAQSRDPYQYRRKRGPRLCSTPRREERRVALRPGHDILFALRRLALNKSLAALHLVGERRLVDLDHHGVGFDAEV